MEQVNRLTEKQIDAINKILSMKNGRAEVAVTKDGIKVFRVERRETRE